MTGNKTGRALVAEWIDHHREPQCASDPRFPDGVDVDVSRGVLPACRIDLDYPAPRCGVWQIACRLCHTNILVTTAGRPDDPRSVKVACKIR